jgi:ABC-2 type transport system permease protein
MDATIPQTRKSKLDLKTWLMSNPVLINELRGRMRGKRAFILMTLYLFFLVVIVGLVYVLNSLSTSAAINNTTNQVQTIGKIIFFVIVGLEITSICLIAPALTAGSISSERERHTYDLLHTTLLTARQLVYGKFLSGWVFILLLILTALPVLSLSFLFGGISTEEMWMNALLLVVISFNFCSIGIFFSSIIKNTLAATVVSYAVPILTIFGVPILLLVFSGMISSVMNFSSMNRQAMPLAQQQLLLAGAWFLVLTNPVASLVANEACLVDQHSIFLYNFSLSNGNSTPVIMPWIGFTVLCLLFSLILLTLATIFARRTER